MFNISATAAFLFGCWRPIPWIRQLWSAFAMSADPELSSVPPLWRREGRINKTINSLASQKLSWNTFHPELTSSRKSIYALGAFSKQGLLFVFRSANQDKVVVFGLGSIQTWTRMSWRSFQPELGQSGGSIALEHLQRANTDCYTESWATMWRSQRRQRRHNLWASSLSHS